MAKVDHQIRNQCLICTLERVHDTNSRILQLPEHYSFKRITTEVSVTGRYSSMVNSLDFFGTGIILGFLHTLELCTVLETNLIFLQKLYTADCAILT